jgi:hypothetical protein
MEHDFHSATENECLNEIQLSGKMRLTKLLPVSFFPNSSSRTGFHILCLTRTFLSRTYFERIKL